MLFKTIIGNIYEAEIDEPFWKPYVYVYIYIYVYIYTADSKKVVLQNPKP
jgi:hypothetical protein